MKFEITSYPNSYLKVNFEKNEKIIIEKGCFISSSGEYNFENKIEAKINKSKNELLDEVDEVKSELFEKVDKITNKITGKTNKIEDKIKSQGQKLEDRFKKLF